MTTQKSPGGSIFPYGYKGGEIFGVHFGSFHADEEGLLAHMRAEEEFIANTHRQFPIWFDFYETNLTDKILVEFLASIYRLSKHFTKLAIVGCSPRERKRMDKLRRQSNVQFIMPIHFFDDPEIAKTWLVSEAS